MPIHPLDVRVRSGAIRHVPRQATEFGAEESVIARGDGIDVRTGGGVKTACWWASVDPVYKATVNSGRDRKEVECRSQTPPIMLFPLHLACNVTFVYLVPSRYPVSTTP
jgi:hypothetical protein